MTISNILQKGNIVYVDYDLLKQERERVECNKSTSSHPLYCTNSSEIKIVVHYFANTIQQAQNLDQLFSILETVETKVPFKIRKQLKKLLRGLIEEKLRELGYYRTVRT